ncbi:hypothetical protein AMS68_003286 [Peltaster fructicola]|uniref:DUF7514 domain-containing protein n=1 Tax=Peltaster fructicola TaxID=286661 RepID=A0A6H0XT21_9PEZI|nr:hypothetical protein AMS68_003286 [Peltaster fructicola]
MADYRRAISPPLPPDPRRISQHISPDDQSQQSDHDSLPARSTTSSRHSSRAPSRPRPVLHQPQPIHDAVGSAFSESISQAPVDPHIDPTLLDKIVVLVAEKLSRQDLGTSYPPPLASQETEPRSPTQSSVASFTSRHSRQVSQERGRSTRSGIGSPEPMIPSGELDIEEGDSHRDMRDEATPRPSSTAGRSSRAGSGVEPLYKTMSNTSQKRVDSLASSPTFSDWDDVTGVERAWEPLFDRNGDPQPRLAHFLRGLALHLIEEYEPKDSLVVTPVKMQRFFHETALPDEQYPWHVIFTQVSSTSLSTIYQRLLAEHHLVQVPNHSAPNVPALTPRGFATFMTCLIQAHPDHEYQRLSEAVKQMPVSSAVDRKFRFPKELSRRLLPQRSNVHAAQRLTASMAHEPRIQLRNPTSLPPPPPPQAQEADVISPPAQVPERRRMPYSRRANSNSFENEDFATPAAPIERERKPYTAREGTGKYHESPPDRQSRPEESYRPTRQNVGSSYGAPNPQPSVSRSRMPTGPGTAPPVSYNNNFPRNSGSSYARSDTGGYDGTHQSSAAYPRAGSDVDDSDRRQSRRQTVPSTHPDDSRGRPIPTRSGQNEYSNVNMPPQLPTLGTSFPSQRSQPLYDERRRSAYSAFPASAGNDGWSSFPDERQSRPPLDQGDGFRQ